MQGLAGPAVYAEKTRGQPTLVMSAYPMLTSFPLMPSELLSYEPDSLPISRSAVKYFSRNAVRKSRKTLLIGRRRTGLDEIGARTRRSCSTC
jgi:hypothetical protein